MTKKSVTVRDAKSFRHYLAPEYLTACSDAIISADQTISLVRLIDQVAAFAYPVPLTRFVVVAQLWRNDKVPIEEFSRIQFSQKLVVVNPKGDVMELGENKPLLNLDSPWFTTRSIFDLSGRMGLKQPGLYTLKLLGKVGDGEYEEIIEKKFPALLITGLPGFYTVQFTSDENTDEAKKQGTGFVLLSPDGKIQGGDNGYDYQGVYHLEDNKLHANIQIRRRNPDAQSIYGDVEEFEVKVEGKVEEETLSLFGHRIEDPTQKIALLLNKQTEIPGAAI